MLRRSTYRTSVPATCNRTQGLQSPLPRQLHMPGVDGSRCYASPSTTPSPPVLRFLFNGPERVSHQRRWLKVHTLPLQVHCLLPPGPPTSPHQSGNSTLSTIRIAISMRAHEIGPMQPAAATFIKKVQRSSGLHSTAGQHDLFAVYGSRGTCVEVWCTSSLPSMSQHVLVALLSIDLDVTSALVTIDFSDEYSVPLNGLENT